MDSTHPRLTVNDPETLLSSSVPREDESGLFAAVGGFGVLAVAALLSGVREQVGQTNVALVFVLLVVACAALGGRLAGGTTAIMAALTFNFFFTKPYLTLRITARDDIVRTVLLLLVGLLVGELTVLSKRRQTTTHETRQSSSHLHHAVTMVRDGSPLDRLWPEVQQGIIDALGAAECRFERVDMAGITLPELSDAVSSAKALTYGPGGFHLPADGLQLTVGDMQNPSGRIVVLGSDNRGRSILHRSTAATLADILALGMRDQTIPEQLT
jgi:hypothetical protein